jgi:hypothetical protein
MPARKGDDKKQRRTDTIPASRLTYILYIGILVLAVAVLYFSVAEYILYSQQLPKEELSLNITSNGAESFADGFHPVLVITAAAREKSAIQIKLSSAAYSTQYSSGDYVNNYTALAVLPTDAFSTEFNVTATASDKNGKVLTRMAAVTTQQEPKVVFGVR